MDYENVIRDIAKRTHRNLEFVRKAARQDQLASFAPQVYEVTQLINSMLGLLVFPQQEYFSSIERTPLDQLVADGWPRIRTTEGFRDLADLRELLRYLRNAITHFNIEFVAPEGQIEGIRVWNCPDGKSGNKDWEAEISLNDLERITEKFNHMVEDYPANNPRSATPNCRPTTH